MEVRFRQGSNNVTLECEVRDTDQEIVELSGATVSLKVHRDSGVYSQSGVVTDPANGICQFTLTSAGALAESGTWPAEVVVILTGSVTVVSDSFTFVVD